VKQVPFNNVSEFQQWKTVVRRKWEKTALCELLWNYSDSPVHCPNPP